MRTPKPNLFIPGAGKSGTSTFHELLNQHPNICMSSVKEPHFWTKLDFDSYTNEDWNTYLDLFNECSNSLYRGESSTGYMQFPNFIERIKANYETLPKFIFILRNPIDRCYSHYWWLKGMGSETSSLINAIQNDFHVEPNHTTKLPEANYKSYYQYGLYNKWLVRFYSNFEKETIKIITYESLRDNRLETLNDCFDFLGLTKLDSISKIHSNKTQILKYPYLYKYAKLITWDQLKTPKWIKKITPKLFKDFLRKNLMKTVLKLTKTNKTYPKINLEERKYIANLYEKDVEQLKALTGLSFNEWTDFNS